MGVTHDLAAAITGFAFDPEAEEALIERARNALVDSLAVAVAARHDEGYLAVRAALRGERGLGRSSLLAEAGSTTPALAAFLNGFAVHALDYDDVSDTIYGHPSSVILPPVLAMAEDRGVPLLDVLRSYVVGYDVACAVAEALPVRPHYSNGWHATATVGVIGGAAALAHLAGLGVEETAHALGVAATTASGSRQNFGSMTKPFHAAHAARNAVTAFQLAEQGFTADAAALEGPIGYFHLFGDGIPSGLRRPAGDATNDLLAEGLNVKRYPCCYNTHRSADAARVLHGKVEVGEIERIGVTVEPRGLDPLIHHRPTTGTEAKFSVEYVVAAALIDGSIGLGTFADERVNRPDVQQLLRKVEIGESDVPSIGAAEWDFAFSVVEIDTAGVSLAERVDFPSGHRYSPLASDGIDVKFIDCLAHVGHPDPRGALALVRDPDPARPVDLGSLAAASVQEHAHSASAAHAAHP